jgi:C-terminal processing protease CtpA/Prc
MSPITVTVTKPDADATIGLSLNYYDGGRIVARTVLEEGLFTNTELKAGFVLLSINGTEIKGMSTPAVMKLFLDAEPGEITVVAEDIGLRIASFTKESESSKIGIGLNERQGSIIITSIAEDGLLAKHTNIKVGYRLLAVNGVPTKSLNTRDTVALFRELDSITIMTEETGLKSVTVQKESVATKMGVGMKMINGHIVVSSIAKDGLFANTELQLAKKIVAVNGKLCDGLNLLEAVTLLREAMSTLTVIQEDVGLIAVTVVKEALDTKLGITVADIKEKIVITDIAEDSPFVKTEVAPGLRILYVNGTSCSGLGKSEAVGMLKGAVGDVTLILEKVGMVTAVGVKESSTSKIGIGLKDMSGMVIISSIAPDSIFQNTPLKVGHKILSINKMSVEGMTKFNAIKLFKTLEETITVMAEDVGLVGATVIKPSVDATVGIGIKEKDGALYISSIYDRYEARKFESYECSGYEQG